MITQNKESKYLFNIANQYDWRCYFSWEAIFVSPPGYGEAGSICQF
jgi:hypothetical protein